MKDLLDKTLGSAIKRLDIFRTILGLLLISLAGYFLYTNFFKLEIKPSFFIFLKSNINYGILFIVIIFLLIYGIYNFSTGIYDMQLNYEMEKTLIQVKFIKALESIKDFDFTLKKLGLSERRIIEFKINFHNKAKKFIEDFK